MITSTSPFRAHFDSHQDADPVFHMTPAQCQAALARHPDLDGKVEITTGWNLANAADVFRSVDAFVGFRMPKEIVRAHEGPLKFIHLIGAGVEHLRPFDWVPADVVLTNNRGVHQQKASEFILMALLLLNSRIPTLANAQAQRRWMPIFTSQAKGKTVLIVGTGHLGSAGAREARKLGFRVIGINRTGQPNPDCDETHAIGRLDALLPQADFVVVSTPSTAQTDGMFTEARYSLMKNGAGFVNFGRARVCDYDALAEHLRTGHLSGAVLDVFDPEPLPVESNLWNVPNLLITPHCSSDDADTYIPMTLDLVFSNIRRSIRAESLLNVVDTKKEY
ncbi:MAG: D-2-hydroxyacid dehydrogenase [Acetobacteraceae bacterium]